MMQLSFRDAGTFGQKLVLAWREDFGGHRTVSFSLVSWRIGRSGGQMEGEGRLPRSVDTSEAWKKTDGLKKIDKMKIKVGSRP